MSLQTLPGNDRGAPRPGDPLPTTHVGAVRRFFLRHPRLMDVLVMAWFGIPGLGTAAMIGVPYQGLDPELYTGGTGVQLDDLRWGTGYAAIALAAVLLGTAALWWRRQRPVTVFVTEVVLGLAVMLLTHQTGGFEYAIAFALYAVAAVRGSRVAWVAFGISGVLLLGALTVSDSFGAAFLTNPSEPPPEMSPRALTLMIWAVVGLAVLVPSLVALAIGVSVHNRRRYVSELVERADRLALEQEQREQLAVGDERTRIARELHDVVAHSLTVMITLAEGAAGIAERDPDRAAGVMRDVAQTGRDALTDTRRVVGVLRSEGDVARGLVGGPGARTSSSFVTADDDAPLAPAPTEALGDLVARFRGAGLPVRLTQSGPELPADNALRLTVFRIVQESLTNVLRHAPMASTITVTIAREPEAIRIEVVNTAGAGPRRPAPGSGRGLIGMRERVAFFGGHLEAGATTAGSPATGLTTTGWRVAATLPWKDPA